MLMRSLIATIPNPKCWQMDGKSKLDYNLVEPSLGVLAPKSVFLQIRCSAILYHIVVSSYLGTTQVLQGEV